MRCPVTGFPCDRCKMECVIHDIKHPNRNEIGHGAKTRKAK